MDMKTVLLSYLISDAICAIVIASLWWQNRRHFQGLGFWLADFVMQFTGLALVTMRGVIPDFVSMVVGNGLVIGGTILLYIGLEHFLGKHSAQLHNATLLALFIFIHTYFAIVYPNLTARNINFAAGLLATCFQCAWLMFRRADVELRPITRGTGFAFAAYCLVSVARISVDTAIPSGNALFHSNLYDTSAVLLYQMLFIVLTFNLFLMVNRRLSMEMKTSLLKLQQAETELKKNQEQLLKFSSQVPGMLYQFEMQPDGSNRVPFTTEGIREIFGCSPEDVRETFDPVAKVIHPDDLPGINAAIAESARKLTPFQAEYRVILPGQPVHWVQANSLPEKLPNGSIIWSGFNTDITERKRAEEALKSSEEKFSKAFYASPDAILISKIKDGLIIEVNEGFSQISGYERGEAVRHSTLALNLWTDPLDREKCVTAIQTDGYIHDYECDFTIKSGKTIHCLYSGELIELNNEAHILSIVRDITERKLSEQALKESEQRYRQMFIEHSATKLLIDPETGSIVQANSAASQFYGYAVETLQNMNIGQINTLPRESILAAMQEARQRKRNYFIFQHRMASGEVRDVEVHSTPINTGGRELLYSIIHDITDRKQAEEALRKSEAHFREVFDNTAHGTFIIDVTEDGSFRIGDSNKAEEILTTIPRDTVMGKTLDEAFPPEIAKALHANYSRSIEAGEAIAYEEDVNLPGVGPRSYYTTLAPVRDKSGRFYRIIGSTLEITERRKTEEALRESEINLNNLIENTDGSIWAIDPNYCLIVGNKEFHRNTSAAMGHQLNKRESVLSLHIPSDANAEWQGHYDRALRGETFSIEISTRFRSVPRQIEYRFSPIRNDAGEIQGTTVYGRDITERKQAEERLAASLERLGLATRAASLGIWDWDIQKNELIWDDGMYELYNVKREDFAGAYEAWLGGVHPDDRAASDEISRQARAGEREYDTEFRIIWPNGAVRVLKAYGQVIWDSNGDPVRMTGVNYDITERKQAEEKLKEANKRLEEQLGEIKILRDYLREQSIRDSLTGLYNRRYLSETIEREFARAKRENYIISIMMIDIDHFKDFNDTYGHQVGDQVLAALGGLLQNSIRQGDIACRYGGEEFLIVMPGIDDGDAKRRAETIRHEFSKLCINPDNTAIRATTSIGLAFYPRHGSDMDQIIKAADAALYEAKQAGRNRAHVWKGK